MFRSLLVTALVIAVPVVAFAQRPAASPASPSATPSPAAEIKLDENTTLKAAALEARLAAVIANLALLQRQVQDLQTEGTKMLEERKALIEDAAKKSNVKVSDANEWAFDNKGQRYVHMRTMPAPAAVPTR